MIHRYRFISEHHARYGVARLCRVLAVPRRQGYYEWVRHEHGGELDVGRAS
jgi:hypothetical protein